MSLLLLGRWQGNWLVEGNNSRRICSGGKRVILISAKMILVQVLHRQTCANRIHAKLKAHLKI